MSAETNVPDHLTFSTATAGDLTVAAKEALAKLPANSTDEHHGIVLAITTSGTWYARVLTHGGVAVLHQGPCSDGWGNGDWQPDNQLRQLAAPGDAITWTSTTNELCPGQLRVSDPGVVITSPSTTSR